MDRHILLATGKIHRLKGGLSFTVTLCGVETCWTKKRPLSKIFIKELPISMRCKKCFGIKKKRIKIPLKKRSLDQILGLVKK